MAREYERAQDDALTLIRAALAKVAERIQGMAPEELAAGQIPAALKTLVEEHGVEIRRLPEDVLRRFAELSTEVLDETGATDELSQRILDSYRAFQQSVRDYHAITEQSYLDTRTTVER